MKPSFKYLIPMIGGMFALAACRDIQDANDRWQAGKDSLEVVDLVEQPPIDSFEPVVVEPKADHDGGEHIPTVDEFVLLDKEPSPLNLDDIKKQIGYPPMAREAEIEGKVIVRILVDEKGKYMKHVVLKDPHTVLTKAVDKQIPKLRFSPGEKDGKAVKTWVTVPFQFTLMK